MTEPFIGEIRMFAGTFAPNGWAFCDGQLLSISQNTALSSLLGTIYGGDGRTTFGLPDLRGRIPLHQGTGPGLQNRRLGDKGGVENVTLNVGQIPSHGHDVNGTTAAATSASPQNLVPADAAINIYSTNAPDVSLNAAAIQNAGGDQPHNNVMPFLGVNFIIALTGTFPSEN